jgi:hypothetical protein
VIGGFGQFAIESIAARCDSYCFLLSMTMRAVRSMTSGVYLVDFFFVTPFSEILKPPRFAGRLVQFIS